MAGNHLDGLGLEVHVVDSEQVVEPICLGGDEFVWDEAIVLQLLGNYNNRQLLLKLQLYLIVRPSRTGNHLCLLAFELGGHIAGALLGQDTVSASRDTEMGGLGRRLAAWSAHHILQLLVQGTLEARWRASARISGRLGVRGQPAVLRGVRHGCGSGFLGAS